MQTVVFDRELDMRVKGSGTRDLFLRMMRTGGEIDINLINIMSILKLALPALILPSSKVNRVARAPPRECPVTYMCQWSQPSSRSSGEGRMRRECMTWRRAALTDRKASMKPLKTQQQLCYKSRVEEGWG